MDDSTDFLATAEADSIPLAVEIIQARVPRHIDLSHLRLLIIGEEKARSNFKDILDYFQRNPDIQMRIQLMLVQGGEAEEVLRLDQLMEDNISGELISMSQLEKDLATARTNSLLNLASELRSTGGRGFATRLIVSDKEKILVRNGGAIFEGWKLVGWLSQEETKAVNWILQPWEAVVEAKEGEDIYTYHVRSHTVRITPKTDGPLRFMIHLVTDGMILQRQGKPIDFSKQGNTEKIENLLARTIETQIKDAIFKAQKEFRIDYLGFEGVVKRQAPKIAKQYQNWDEKFPEIPTEVKVVSRITNFGMIQ